MFYRIRRIKVKKREKIRSRKKFEGMMWAMWPLTWMIGIYVDYDLFL